MDRSDPVSIDSSKSSAKNKNASESTGRRPNASSAAIFGCGNREDTSATRMGLYGALSSCSAAVFLQPLDIIKTRQLLQNASTAPIAVEYSTPPRPLFAIFLVWIQQQQCLTGVRPSIRAAASSIYREYGALGFWRGSLATILRVAPGTGIYFAALGPMMSTWGAVAPLLKTLPLERISGTPVELDPNVVPAWYLGVISGVARGAAVAIFNPISIVKTRMESSLGSGGMLQAFTQLLRNERPFDWFRGSLATICRDFPFSGLFFVVYVNLKSHMGVEADARERVSCYALRNFGCGAFAAATASAITHPFDVLRTRLQLDGVAASAATTSSTAMRSVVHGSERQALAHRGLFRRVAQLAANEGPDVLWRGLGMRLLKRSLMAALTWTSFEEIKSAVSGRT